MNIISCIKKFCIYYRYNTSSVIQSVFLVSWLIYSVIFSKAMLIRLRLFFYLDLIYTFYAAVFLRVFHGSIKLEYLLNIFI